MTRITSGYDVNALITEGPSRWSPQVKFTAPTLTDASPAVRAEYVAAWRAAIETAFASPDFPKAAGKLVMGRPSLSESAGIFRYDNPGGEIAAGSADGRPRCHSAGISTGCPWGYPQGYP